MDGSTAQAEMDFTGVLARGFLIVKRKRWRAKKGEKYWFVNSCIRPDSAKERNYDIDGARHTNHNYSSTCEEAEAMAKKIREVLRDE